ncbi:unnamed protein product, partial [Trichogramma brassicae]
TNSGSSRAKSVDERRARAGENPGTGVLLLLDACVRERSSTRRYIHQTMHWCDDDDSADHQGPSCRRRAIRHQGQRLHRSSRHCESSVAAGIFYIPLLPLPLLALLRINIVVGLYITTAMTYLLSQQQQQQQRTLEIYLAQDGRHAREARQRRGKEITTRWIRRGFDTVFHFYRARQRSMPNDNTTVCGCGVVLDLPKARYGKATTPTRNCNIYIPRNGKENGGGGGHHHRSGKTTKKTSESMEHLSMRGRGPNSRASDMGSTSSVAEHQSSRYSSKNGSGCSNGNASNKKDKRFSSGRRTRSAERISESHYTYIDSGSSIASIRDSAIAEHLYCTIDGEDDDDDDGNNVIVETRAPQQPPQQSTTSATAASAPTTTTTTTASNNAINQQHSTQAAQQQQQNNRPMHAIPSMTSPPPTYDVVIAKTWQHAALRGASPGARAPANLTKTKKNYDLVISARAWNVYKIISFSNQRWRWRRGRSVRASFYTPVTVTYRKLIAKWARKRGGKKIHGLTTLVRGVPVPQAEPAAALAHAAAALDGLVQLVHDAADDDGGQQRRQQPRDTQRRPRAAGQPSRAQGVPDAARAAGRRRARGPAVPPAAQPASGAQEAGGQAAANQSHATQISKRKQSATATHVCGRRFLHGNNGDSVGLRQWNLVLQSHVKKLIIIIVMGEKRATSARDNEVNKKLLTKEQQGNSNNNINYNKRKITIQENTKLKKKFNGSGFIISLLLAGSEDGSSTRLTKHRLFLLPFFDLPGVLFCYYR